MLLQALWRSFGFTKVKVIPYITIATIDLVGDNREIEV